MYRTAKKLFAVAAVIFAAVIAFAPPDTQPRITIAIAGNTSGLEPGDTFATAIGIADNPGFSAMSLRLRLPPGLEMIAAAADGTSDAIYGLHLPACPQGISPAPATPMYGDIYFGWMGRTRNFYDNDVLLMFQFRVTEAAEAGFAPITLAFASGVDGYEIPANFAGSAAGIALPGGGYNLGESVQIVQVSYAGVFLELAAHHVNLFGMPNHPNSTAQFEIVAGGLPPNQTFHFENPAEIGAPGVRFDWQGAVPPGIHVSGYVTTNENGYGVGVVMLTVTG